MAALNYLRSFSGTWQRLRLMKSMLALGSSYPVFVVIGRIDINKNCLASYIYIPYLLTMLTDDRFCPHISEDIV